MKFSITLLLSTSAASISLQSVNALRVPRTFVPAGQSLETLPNGRGIQARAAAEAVGDPQKALVLSASQVQSNAKITGQAAELEPEPGQVASLTSTNNFINFCLTQKGVPLTNGQQIKGGSCNPIVIGRIMARDKTVSSKFMFPKNLATITPNQDFTVKMAIKNLATGRFTNPQTTYLSAPCQVDASDLIIGHSSFVIEKLTSITQTAPANPQQFAFFKGMNTAAVDGVLSATVRGGLAPRVYRMASTNSCANHQPVLGPIAKHGAFDDIIYFTVGK